MMTQTLSAATKLHDYLSSEYAQDQGLIGPDPGIRLNYRIGRFVKSYLRSLPWNDALYYVQGQGYWVLGNWALFDQTGNEAYRDAAIHASKLMLEQQRDNGAWVYPNPEWKGRIATAEGTWGALGLLESYRQTNDSAFLDAAMRWHHFLTKFIGYQKTGDLLAVNYFASRASGRIPNNSAFVLRFLAELTDVTGEDAYSVPCAGLLAFLQTVQKPTGEFPYAVSGVNGDKERPHFQCYQYNAFQCLDLIRYHEVSGDDGALPLISSVLEFLKGGIGDDGHVYYTCGNPHRTVIYHTAATAAAFLKGSYLGVGDYHALADRAYAYILRAQRSNGSFPHSRGDYGVLSDQRSYPRYLAMILYHLLVRVAALNPGKEEAHATTVR